METPKDSIILAKTHPPMYLVHKYWARKPYNVVKSYIQKYSKPGDIVLDPFCGSGVTVAETVLANRKAIGIDVNPFSIFLTMGTLTPVDISSMEKFFTKIFDIVRVQIEPYYGITCQSCGQPAVITKIVWKNTEQNPQNPPKEKIEEIRMSCPHCKKKNIQLDPQIHSSYYENEQSRVNYLNSHFAEETKNLQIQIPNIALKYSNGTKFRQLRHFLIKNPNAEDIFTKRNLIVLGLIRKAINFLIPPNTQETKLLEIRKILLLTFTANIGQSSKMVWVISRRKETLQKKKEVGSWTHHFFWNPTEFFENNPLLGFITRSRKTVRAQRNLHSRLLENKISSIKWTNAWNEFISSKNRVLMYESSSKQISIPDQSVDYIFTDPPYGDSIQYFELSSLWNAWLGISNLDHENYEIIINPRQQKTKESYFDELTTVFRECYRVLKNNRYMTITFHNTDEEIRNGLIESVFRAGFLMDSLVFQMPPRNSLKSYLHYKNTPVGDYFIRFKKSLISNSTKMSFTSSSLKHMIRSSTENILSQRGEPTPYLILLNCIDEELAKYGVFPLQNPQIVQDVFNEMREANFISVDQWNYVGLLSLEQSSSQNITLTNRIIDFLKDISPNLKETDSDLYNLVYEKFNGWDTPDRRDLKRIIEEIKKS